MRSRHSRRFTPLGRRQRSSDDRIDTLREGIRSINLAHLDPSGASSSARGSIEKFSPQYVASRSDHGASSSSNSRPQSVARCVSAEARSSMESYSVAAQLVNAFGLSVVLVHGIILPRRFPTPVGMGWEHLEITRHSRLHHLRDKIRPLRSNARANVAQSLICPGPSVKGTEYHPARARPSTSAHLRAGAETVSSSRRSARTEGR